MTASTEWKEDVAADEETRLPALARRLGDMQRARAAGGAAERALHAKAHAGLRARFVVLPDLPGHARQGLFAEPGERRAYVRLSSGSGARQPDRAPDLRGLAFKVLDVDGPKVLGDARTQDFLLIDSPTVPFRTPDEFVAFVCATAEPKGAAGRVVRELGLLRALGLGLALAGTVRGKPRSLADMVFHTAAAVAFGPYAARLSAVPVRARADLPDAGAERDYLADRTRARVASGPTEWELRAQFFTGPGTPIEDSTRRWDSPHVPVARLVVEAQDASSAAGLRLAEFVERLSFDPWHALVAHRPLGAVMRARKHAYYESTRTRGAIAEPDGGEWGSFD